MKESLIERLRTRASIRRNIQTRKSVQEGQPDRIADLLEEAADEITELESLLDYKEQEIAGLIEQLNSCEYTQSVSD